MRFQLTKGLTTLKNAGKLFKAFVDPPLDVERGCAILP